MRSVGSSALRTWALNPKRSEGRGERRADEIGIEPVSHDPHATITTGARSSAQRPASRDSARQRYSFLSAVTAAACHGCRTSTPASAARRSKSVSRCSRESARPHLGVPLPARGRSALRLIAPDKTPTRRTSGPAMAWNVSAMPMASNNGQLVNDRYSPHTFRRGNRARSTSTTDQPARANKSAVTAPAGPPPSTMASLTYRLQLSKKR